LEDADRRLEELAGTARLGALARDGVRVVIGGRPNAGKSTLLNALVGEDRAIVSPTAGTTRDAVEADAELGGLRIRFLDTAGLRETADAIEAEGTRRARAAIDRADVLLYVVDATLGLDAEERAFLDDRRDVPVVLVANKSDLDGALALDGAIPISAQSALEDASALGELRSLVLEAVQAGGLDSAAAGGVLVNERHRAHLEAARDAVGRAQSALEDGTGGDTLSLDLRAAMHELGLVTGAVTTEHVLDAVFSQFCIGK
ncbi:GTPase, partial [Rubrivirga sp.]|uniref:GTPase n=1 Tax=Rubrivirga sp. TaxID=1885344 RepID=UPI003C7435AD